MSAALFLCDATVSKKMEKIQHLTVWKCFNWSPNKKANNPVSNTSIVVIVLFNFLKFASYISAKFLKGHPDRNNSRHIKL